MIQDLLPQVGGKSIHIQSDDGPPLNGTLCNIVRQKRYSNVILNQMADHISAAIFQDGLDLRESFASHSSSRRR